MMDLRTKDDLIEFIGSRGIYIYGAGYIGKSFLRALQLNKLDNKVICFIVSQNNDHHGIDGYKVKQLNEISESFNPQKQIICIATHESIKDVIINELICLGINEYVWIYPCLHDLFFGKPIEVNKKVPINRIIQSSMDNYSLPIRLLAIGQYFGENNFGYDTYVKAQQMHCENDTAKKRLSRFIELIEKCQDKGYDCSSRLKIDQNCNVLDGYHRLSLAYYYGLNELYCDIYKGNEALMRAKEAIFMKDSIKEISFSDEVINAINAIECKLKERIGE